MSRPQNPAPAVSLTPEEGWHCLHLFYRWKREVLDALGEQRRFDGKEHLAQVLAPQGEEAPQRLQLSIVAGHKADWALLLLDPDPLKLDAVHQQVMSSPLGPAVEPVYSFVSLTEVSEYVPTPEQYGQRLIEQGEEPDSPSYKAKVKAYAQREEAMRRQRLYPEFPPWPVTCFYPMNKKREVGANWFTLPFEERNRLMTEHGHTGMKFGGKVTQLITVGIGLEDWEWGVTLWAANPQYLKEIVYTMRFDEASAVYAEFGPFYTSYVATPEEMFRHCRI